MFKDKVVVITGGASGIGRNIAEAFMNEGAKVAVIDQQESDQNFTLFFQGNISDESVLLAFKSKVIETFGNVDFLINNACISKGGILSSCSYEDFLYVQKIGVVAPYYLSMLLLPHFSNHGAIVNISSTRAFQSQPDTESYTAAKGGITALTHGLAISLSGKVRVNSITPGWIDTTDSTFSKSDASQHPVGRVGQPKDIANMVLFLCSDKASFMTGENITIDGGMSKLMIYHNDEGWSFSK
ncbi:MAG: SDR family oxidoreductase [Clostridia bacterium]|nr:SDR family oxidoreductase [Clostridia bacterium]